MKKIIMLLAFLLLIVGCKDKNQYTTEMDRTQQLRDYLSSIDPETTNVEICNSKLKQIMGTVDTLRQEETFYKGDLIVSETTNSRVSEGEKFYIKGNKENLGKMRLTVSVQQFSAVERIDGKNDLIKSFPDLLIGKKINVECKFHSEPLGYDLGCFFNKGYLPGVNIKLDGRTCNIK
jgi:hypothetical protein